MSKDKISVRNLETVESLQNAIEENKQKVRELKRADSELRLKMAVKNMDSDEIKDKIEVLRACYDYVAQHRTLYKSTRKNSLPVTGAY